MFHALRSPTIARAPLTHMEFVTKNTRKSANSDRELDSPILCSGIPPSAWYAKMASASARVSWAALKTVLIRSLLATNWPARDAAATTTTLTQWGAMAALAKTGMNETDPMDPRPVR